MTAAELFAIKIRTGLYDHYTPEQLDALYADCSKQASLMAEFNGNKEE